ncbi:MAG: DUF1080 domain-containing protein [Planctomycetes bacterium]|nr:DUF1080 domain-containing protein [Planctomycetota bacterium]
MGSMPFRRRMAVAAVGAVAMIALSCDAGENRLRWRRLFRRPSSVGSCTARSGDPDPKPADTAPPSVPPSPDSARSESAAPPVEPKRTEGAGGERSPSDLVKSEPAAAWTAMLEGPPLTLWKPVRFGGEGDVELNENQIVMGMGSSMTGAHFTGDVLRTNYEVDFEARRLEGIDFFCAFTFPVGESYCSFIVGGWAGGIVGLSSIDGNDASQNATTKYMTFKNEQWYRMRVRVTTETIEAWIDDQPVVYQNLAGHRIGTRAEVDPSRPFGFSTWETKGEIRNLRIRAVTPGSSP